jgi:type IV secretory pathway VirB3-like protein
MAKMRVFIYNHSTLFRVLMIAVVYVIVEMAFSRIVAAIALFLYLLTCIREYRLSRIVATQEDTDTLLMSARAAFLYQAEIAGKLRALPPKTT